MNRDKQERVKPWEVEKALRQSFSTKTCSVPEEWRKDCIGLPIRAHTVPRSGSLQKIARDGHVYTFVPSFNNLIEHAGRVPPKLLGVNRASTFTGFCAKHDASLFSPLENSRFTGTAEQCFLLGYRAWAREAYTKKASAALSETRRGMDRGLPEKEQFRIQETSFLFDVGTSAGLRDNEYHGQELAALLLAKDYSPVRAYIVEVEEAPDVMCSGGMFPERTFDGEILQDIGDPTVEAQLLTLSSFADEERGYIVFTWLPNSDDVNGRFIRSLEEVSDESLTSALIRLMFEYFENVFIRPDWWESLPTTHQDYLIMRMSSIFDHLAGAKPSGDISDDGIEFLPLKVLARWHVGPLNSNRVAGRI